MRTNHTCPTILPLRRGQRRVRVGCAGFTLTELLVVIAIVSLLIGVLVLGVRGLSGGTSRRAAVGTLMGVFDQARAVAIADGRATYVVFVSAPRGNAPVDADKVATTMWGRAYALFEDPVLTDTMDSTSFQPQQRSNWLYLPTGVAFKSDPGTPASLTDSGPGANDLGVAFKVPAASGSVSVKLPYVKFDSAGQVMDHVNNPSQVLDPTSNRLRVLLFEGMTNSAGTETVLRRNAGTSGANIKYGLDEILLKPTTGRARYTFDPANNLATPTPAS